MRGFRRLGAGWRFYRVNYADEDKAIDCMILWFKNRPIWRQLAGFGDFRRLGAGWRFNR